MKKKKIGFKLIILSLLFIPGLQDLFIIGCNSSYLIRKPFLILIAILIFIFVFTLLYGLFLFENNKKESKRKLKKWVKVIISTFMTIYMLGCILFVLLMYGPWDKFRNLYITTAMKTMHHQYLARIFYTDETINEVMNRNYFIAIEEDVNENEIQIDTDEKKKYANEYEKELLTRDEGNDLYKIIHLKVGGSNAYLVAIYDPKKVQMIRTKNFNIGTTGERVITMCNRYGGVVCINAGGFVDYGYGSDIPIGVVIDDGNVIWPLTNLETTRSNIVGLTYDGKLKLMSNATAQEALNAGIKDAIDFSPFLIVNGKAIEIVGDPWGKAPRIVIAQRKDGVMMFLTVDGENYINGASLKELVEVLQRYGAYNAANLDGGQSATLIVEGKLYNTPPPAAKAQGGRYVVTGFGLIP